MTEQYDLRDGLEPLAMIGNVVPRGKRVLLRAILETDYYTGALTLPVYNAAEAIAFVVVACGTDVPDDVRPGDVVDCRAVAADRINSKDPTGRFWLVDEQDIGAIANVPSLDEEGLLEAIAHVRKRQSMSVMAKPSDGSAELEPRR